MYTYHFEKVQCHIYTDSISLTMDIIELLQDLQVNPKYILNTNHSEHKYWYSIPSECNKTNRATTKQCYHRRCCTEVEMHSTTRSAWHGVFCILYSIVFQREGRHSPGLAENSWTFGVRSKWNGCGIIPWFPLMLIGQQRWTMQCARGERPSSSSAVSSVTFVASCTQVWWSPRQSDLIRIKCIIPKGDRFPGRSQKLHWWMSERILKGFMP